MTGEVVSGKQSLLSLDEYQLLAISFVERNISWTVAEKEVFAGVPTPHPMVLSSFRQLYVDTLKEAVMGCVLDNIAKLCCLRDENFFRLLKENATLTIMSPLIDQIANLRWHNDNDRACLERSQLAELRKHIEDDARLCKKLTSRILKLCSELMGHFSNNKPEVVFCRLVTSWFQSGDMSLPQWKQWKEAYELKRISLSDLRNISWKADEGDSHLQKLRFAMEDIRKDCFFEETSKKLGEIVARFLRSPRIEEVPTPQGTLLRVDARLMFLSDVLPHIRSCFVKHDDVFEVRFFAKDCLVIDDCLMNTEWNGKNVAIVAEKIRVTIRKATIDVSGLGSNKDVIGKAAGGGVGSPGSHGQDGDAGESSGNIAIVTNEIRNADSLILKMNGGNGGGGEHGGDGGDGRNGVGVGRDDIDKYCVSYGSLYFTGWSHFVENYSPGGSWTKEEGVWDSSAKYVWRRYTDEYGREIFYSLAADKGWTYTTYDLYFLMRGSRGTMAGQGGRNGVGGEAGNKGELQAVQLSTGKQLIDLIVHQQQGEDGRDGVRGKSGTPGKHGNDMVLIDRSAKKPSKHYIGSQNKTLLVKNYYKADDYTRLDGQLRAEGKNAAFVGFDTVNVDVLSLTEEAQTRTSTDRRSQSKTVSKSTIVLESVMNEFSELFADDEQMVELTVSDEREWQEIDMEEEIEEEEVVQQEVSVVRTHVEESGKHERNLRMNSVNPEGVLMRLAAVNESTALMEMMSLCTDIFSVPLHITYEINAALDRFMEMFCTEYIDGCFAAKNVRPTAMTKEDVLRFRLDGQEKMKRKKILSTLIPMFEPPAISNDLQLEDNCLKFISIQDVDTFWTENDASNAKAKERLEEFLEDQMFFSATTALLIELHEIYHALDEKKELFDAFKKSDLNWTDLDGVTDHLDKFLTEEEQKKKEEKQQKQQKKEAERIEMEEQNQPNDATITMFNTGYEQGASLLQSGKNKLSTFFGSATAGEAFKKIAKYASKHSTIFDNLNKLTKTNPSIYERFAIGAGRYNRPALGSTEYSAIQLYYVSQQYLDYNIRLLRYWKLYSANVLIPTDWLCSTTGIEDDFSYKAFRNILDSEGMPLVDNRLSSFMEQGVRCAAYRHFLSDSLQINIRVFFDSGYCTVRLLENINPQYKVTKQLHFARNGNIGTIVPNEGIRQLRGRTTSKKLNIPLPLSDHVVQIDRWFHSSFKDIVQEWSRAVEVSTGSDTLLRFLQELYTLRGCSTNLVEFQFMINTIIDIHNNIDISMDQLCRRVLEKDGNMDDMWLAVRVVCSMKGDIEGSVSLMERLHTITEPRLRALFGSKLHEILLDEETLQILINMLAHAGDRVEELSKMELKQWIDIAKCQKWKDFEPLLKQFGSVGYYIVYLDSNQRPEGELLKNIIQNLAKKKCYLLEKVISRIAFLITYNEVNFNESYEGDVVKMLKMLSDAETEGQVISSLCKMTNENIMQTGNFHLVTNEHAQMQLLNMYSEKEKDTMERVFCQRDRSLEDLINLTVNPHELPTNCDNRRQHMKDVKEAIESISDGEPINMWAKHLKEIDAVLQETCKIQLRSTQKIAILTAVMNKENLLSQVNTGEGKSYIIAALALMRILASGKKDTVDIITSSSVLAQRDVDDMRKVYAAFGITVGHNCEEDLEKRKTAYKCSVVYGDIARFERDHLLHTFYKKNILGSRTRCCVIVDEVDSMLLDNGGNMLYLSHTVAGMELLEPLFVYIHKEIRKPTTSGTIHSSHDTFTSDTIRQNVIRDMCGMISKKDISDLLGADSISSVGTVWRSLLENNIIEDNGAGRKYSSVSLAKLRTQLLAECDPETTDRVFTMLAALRDRQREIDVPEYLHNVAIRHLDEFIENAKKALFLEHEIEYVVDLDRTAQSGDLNAQITIIDRGTGTDLNTSQWSEGLHQFLQLKHGCRLAPLSMKAVFVSNVTYLKGYKTLNGFSGTLGSAEESKSLVNLYQTDLLRIPTWKAKNFNENVPVLTTKNKEWIQKMFDEVCDQVIAGRSVLVICQSISDVNEVSDGFNKLYHDIDCTTISEQEYAAISNCFKSTTVYKRQYDDFDFSSTNGLDCSRLIISTNLAGRGTDIKLKDELAYAGGLHVIVSFLPENSRIEDQAYGRAARCGQPGSGQIIALVADGAETGNNIFQLKQFRDNAEVHRLRSLKQYYEYHIEVEEKCLNLFRDHCSHALEQVHTGNGLEDTLPTASQVVYFALLDEWADWLDARAEDIKLCEKNCSSSDKAFIIKEVETFLAAHPLPNKMIPSRSPSTIASNAADTWISTPQPIITLALIDISENQMTEADAKLDRVINNFPEFAAEASYFKGIIAQQKIRQLKDNLLEKEGEAIKWEKVKDPLHYLQYGLDKITPFIGRGAASVAKQAVDDIRDTPEFLISNSVEQLQISFRHLLLSRALFATRIARKADLAKVVTMLQSSKTEIISRGYANQQDEARSVLEGVIGNIDDMLGHSVNIEDLKDGDELPHISVGRFEAFVQSGIISDVTLAEDIGIEQLKMISRKHNLSMTTIKSALQAVRSTRTIENNKTLMNETEAGKMIIDLAHLPKFFHLPSILDFWTTIDRSGGFLYRRSLLAIKQTDIELAPELRTLKKTTLEKSPFYVQASTKDLDQYFLYELNEESIKDELAACLMEYQQAGVISVEVIGVLNPYIARESIQLDKFDFISIEDVATELNLPLSAAEWIINKFVQEHILEPFTAEIPLKRKDSEESGFVSEDEISEQQEAEETFQKDTHQENGTKRTMDQDQDGLKSSSSHLPPTSKEENSSNPTVNDPPTSATPVEKKETKTLYRLVDRAKCTSFPSNMQPSLQRMLAKHFCYGYAFKMLQHSVRDALEGKTPSHHILLPIDPYADLYADLLTTGILQRHRITTTLEGVYHPTPITNTSKIGNTLLNAGKSVWNTVTSKSVWNTVINSDISIEEVDWEKDEKHCIPEVVYNRLEKKKPNILLNASTLHASTGFFKEKCVPFGGEMKKIIANGMRQLARIEKPNPWKWWFQIFVKVALAVLLVMFVVAAPLTFLIALAVVAAVGTTLYIMSMYTESQKFFAGRDGIDDVEEFTVLRSCHEVAVQENKTEQSRQAVAKVLDELSNEFMLKLENELEKFVDVVDSEEEVDICLLSQACKESSHMILLQQGIQNWMWTASRKLQQECHDLMSGWSTDTTSLPRSELEPRLRRIVDRLQLSQPPAAIFAFASLLVEDVNEKLKAKRLDTVKTRLDYDRYIDNVNSTEESDLEDESEGDSESENGNTAESEKVDTSSEDESEADSESENGSTAESEKDALSAKAKLTITAGIRSVLSACIQPVVKVEKDTTVHQAGQRINSLVRAKPFVGALQLDDETIKGRSIRHSGDHLAKQGASDILSTDLQNIFLRICYKELQPKVLRHMVKHNYPLSPHCAGPIMNATCLLLLSLGIKIGSVYVFLKRDKQTIFTYSIRSRSGEKSPMARLTLQLFDECFYTTETLESASTHTTFPTGLFQVLCGQFKQFADRYLVGPEEFVSSLEHLIGEDVLFERNWTAASKWHAQEKLLCSVAL